MQENSWKVKYKMNKSNNLFAFKVGNISMKKM